MTDNAPVILWLRQDLRLTDNPALLAAVETGRPVIPLYILDDDMPFSPGGAARWWLHHSLTALKADLAKAGAHLWLERGDSAKALDRVIEKTGAKAVCWNRLYDGHSVKRDTAIKADLKARGLTVDTCNAALLFEPWEIAIKTGGPYKVFTAFWKACRAHHHSHAPDDPPRKVHGPPAHGDALADWKLLPTHPDWANGFDGWTPGEDGALEALDTFLDHAVKGYVHGRDRPGDEVGTSRLSPHLHFGEIGPRQVWAALRGAGGQGAATFESEIGWREFSHHVLFHFPTMPTENLRDGFDGFPWKKHPKGLKAWKTGMTGFPMVDAGMRQLWTTGWMHNRVRMIVASFLVKDLMIDWRVGADWFWDTLVDADLANNSFNWQWTAGCGFDAAPYFRVFNPNGQGERFDADGKYIRRWCPELAKLPDKWIQRPAQAPAEVLAKAGVELGKTYPRPIVDHAVARDEALAAFKSIRKTAAHPREGGDPGD